MSSRVELPSALEATARASSVPQVLLCRVRGRRCALRLDEVIETMRPLPIAPVGAVPAFVLGLAVVRGSPTAVVDLGALLGAADGAAPRRFVTVRAGRRAVALAVDDVLGVHALPVAALEQLPPLLRQATDTVEAVGTADAELLLVLRTARLVPDELWSTLEAGGATS